MNSAAAAPAHRNHGAERIRIVKRQAGALQNVTSALGCGDCAIAPALSVIVSGAILMTVRRAYRAERGAEPGCLAQPAHYGLHQLVVGFYGVRSIGHGRARAGEPDLQSTLPCARSQAADVPAAVTAHLRVAWKRGGHGRFGGSYEVLASHR